MVFAQDDPAVRLYVLLSGRVAIRFKPHDGDWLTVTEIAPGGVFGWSAALGRRSYTSSAQCIESGQALSLRGADLRRLYETQPETGVVILERLAEVIAERLRSTHEQVVDLLRLGIRSQDAT
jgi:CRP-like cAMP-binding protein